MLAFGNYQSRQGGTRADTQAHWKPPHLRADLVELLAASMKGRLSRLIPIKLERMAAPFGFFSGAASVMAPFLLGLAV